MPLYEDGHITPGCIIINYQKVISPGMVTRYQSCSAQTVNNQSMDLKETALMIISPSIKKFADEDSREAEDYFTAMDDWSYYTSQIAQRYEALGVQVIHSGKKTLSFFTCK